MTGIHIVRVIGIAAGALALSAEISVPAYAADWTPSQPVEVIVPFGAGGGTDVTIRTLVQIVNDRNLSPQPWVVTNKSGGGGTVGQKYVTDQQSNEHLLLAFGVTNILRNVQDESAGLSWERLTPIGNLVLDVQYLTVAAGGGIEDLDQFLERAKAKPGDLRVSGGAGVGSEDHTTTLIMERSGLEVQYVPFADGGEQKQNIAGGHVDAGWLNPAEMSGLLESDGGNLRPIAAAWPERTNEFPDVPTFTEMKYDVVFPSFFRGVMAPGDISKDAKKFYADVVAKATADPAWAEKMAGFKIINRHMDPDEFGTELGEWEQQIRELTTQAQQ